jgi:hypothetical protein
MPLGPVTCADYPMDNLAIDSEGHVWAAGDVFCRLGSSPLVEMEWIRSLPEPLNAAQWSF